MLPDFSCARKTKIALIGHFQCDRQACPCSDHHLPFAEQTYRATSTPPPHVLVHQSPSYSSMRLPRLLFSLAVTCLGSLHPLRTLCTSGVK
ncbi:hypothetical protein K523DRAFT_391728 [Schizophyllum commune Tattone D]|nr:hypothetical protein K523DRAFT_391728 [Schizophyllum commune Tattone D]